MYAAGLSNERIANNVQSMGYGKERIIADSAEPKSIDQLKGLGLKVKGAEKGKDSVNHGIQFIQDYEIIIHPRCVNFLTEISNYTWDKDKLGNKLNRPIDDFNHLMDAMRYALENSLQKAADGCIRGRRLHNVITRTIICRRIKTEKCSNLVRHHTLYVLERRVW